MYSLSRDLVAGKLDTLGLGFRGVVAGSGTISIDIETYKIKEIEDGFKRTSVITSVALAVRGNREDKLGSNWADHERCELSEDELIKAHDVLDAKYLRESTELALCTMPYSRGVRKRLRPPGSGLF